MPDFAQPARARYTIDIDAYLLASTAFSVFLWRFLFTGAFNFLAGYIIVLLNSLLLFARGTMAIHRNHLLFLVSAAAISIIADTITHNPLSGTIAQMFGISLFSIYHYSVLSRTGHSVEQVMDIYTWFALAVAVIGFVPWAYELAIGNPYYRFCSIFYEPSHYVYATLPALSYCVLRWHRHGDMKFPATMFLLTYVLADSSTGFIGIAITLLLMADFRSARRVILAVFLTVSACAAAYTLSANVRLRVDDTLTAQVNTEVADAVNTPVTASAQGLESENASTFALLSNAYVAWQAFIASPLIGNGLGSHSSSYGKYAPDIMSPQFPIWGLNSDDANSLFLRLMSETGILGLATIFYLIIFFARVEGSGARIIRNAMLPYIALRLFRFGAYFSMENFFFIMIYGLNFLEDRASRAEARGSA